MPSIDLNCDLGESFGAYTIGMDAEILPYVTSANIACGFHAGDPAARQTSALLCKKHGAQTCKRGNCQITGQGRNAEPSFFHNVSKSCLGGIDGLFIGKVFGGGTD